MYEILFPTSYGGPCYCTGGHVLEEAISYGRRSPGINGILTVQGTLHEVVRMEDLFTVQSSSRNPAIAHHARFQLPRLGVPMEDSVADFIKDDE